MPAWGLYQKIRCCIKLQKISAKNDPVSLFFHDSLAVLILIIPKVPSVQYVVLQISCYKNYYFNLVKFSTDRLTNYVTETFRQDKNGQSYIGLLHCLH